MISYEKLYKTAQGMLDRAYAPYSGFHVAAALQTADGKVYTGVNVENATYGATICAERTAAVTAVAAGSREFVAIAIVSSGGAAMPCGICRQFLAEFCEDMDVITGDDVESLHVYKLSELIPYTFKL